MGSRKYSLLARFDAGRLVISAAIYTYVCKLIDMNSDRGTCARYSYPPLPNYNSSPSSSTFHLQLYECMAPWLPYNYVKLGSWSIVCDLCHFIYNYACMYTYNYVHKHIIKCISSYYFQINT